VTTFLVLGAGLMARALVYDLEKFSNPIKVIVVDRDQNALQSIQGAHVETHCGDLANEDFTAPFFEKADVACGAASYKLNSQLARQAIAHNVHFVDLGGNNTVVDEEFNLSDQAFAIDVTIIPDCGLAPGMASVLVAAGVAQLDKIESIKIRVGGLPQSPQPPLNYAVFFSPEGLLNEYRERTVVLRDGKLTQLDSLTEPEELSFPPNFPKLEAYHTSGGASTLPQSFAGKVSSLDYKTLRYPGHFEKIKLLFDLGLADEEPVRLGDVEVVPDHLLRELLYRKLPRNAPDVVLVWVELIGTASGSTKKLSYYIEDYLDDATGHSAMQRTTAYSAAIVMQMLADGTIAKRGTLRAEDGINPQVFLQHLDERGIKVEFKSEDQA